MFSRKQLQGKLTDAELDAMQNEIKYEYALELLSRIDDGLYPNIKSFEPLLVEHFKRLAYKKSL